MKNPDFAQIKLRIDDNEFHPAPGQAPDHIIEIEITRVTESTLSETSIVVYDDSAFIVEAMLLSGGTHTIYLQYGWGDNMSKTYVREVSRYELEFNSQGSTLTIESIPNSTEDVIDETPQSYTGSSFVDIVNQYCESKGITIDGKIEASKSLYDKDFTTADATTQYPKENESDEDFIRRMLSKCVPESGGCYEIVMKDETDEDGNVTRHLKVTTTGGGGSDTVITKKFTYVLGKEHEEIISFTPENNVGLIAGFTGAAFVASGVNPLTNDVQVVTTQRLDDKGKTIRKIAGSCYTNNEMLSMQNAIMAGMAEQQYTAELVLVGTVDIEPEDEIDMSVLTKDGIQHHSSGVYTVKQVTDSISGGSFTTTLLMCKGMEIDSASFVNGDEATPNKFQFVENYAYSQLFGYAFIPEDVPDHNLLGHVQDLLGIKYLAGGTSVAKGLDAGALMHHLIYKATTIYEPFETDKLAKKGKAVSGGRSSWKTGDLLFWPKPAATFAGNSNAEKCWYYFKSKGISDYNIAGLLGCWTCESNIKPKRIEADYLKKFPGYTALISNNTINANAMHNWSKYVFSRTAYEIHYPTYTVNGKYVVGIGLAAFTGANAVALCNYAKETGGQWDSLETQLMFISERYDSYSALKRPANSVAEGTQNALAYFEGMGRKWRNSHPKEWRQRLSAANNIYNQFHGKAQATNTATEKQEYIHVACYIGNNYIFQTTSAYGYSHISKLSSVDLKAINTVRRFDGMYTCDPTEDGYKKQQVSSINGKSKLSEESFIAFCKQHNLTEALNSSGIPREIAKFAVLACINELPYYWGGGHAGLPVYPGWENNNFGKSTRPDKDGRRLVGCDCSGFTGWCYISAYKSLGISGNPPICHPTSNGKYYMETVRGACAILKRVSTPAVGDYLAFANEGHTGIYMGNGMCIHSSYSKAKVVCIKSSVVGFTKQYRL